MKTATCLLRVTMGFSIVVGGLLLTAVHHDIASMSASPPIITSFLLYPLAIVTYLVGLGCCLRLCLCDAKKRFYLWMFVGITLNFISMMLLFLTWILIIRLYALPLTL